jgi:hypothetical protein
MIKNTTAHLALIIWGGIIEFICDSKNLVWL